MRKRNSLVWMRGAAVLALTVLLLPSAVLADDGGPDTIFGAGVAREWPVTLEGWIAWDCGGDACPVTWTLYQDGTFSNGEEIVGIWRYRASSRRLMMRYRTDCRPDYVGRMRGAGHFEGELFCRDLGEGGIWAADLVR